MWVQGNAAGGRPGDVGGDLEGKNNKERKHSSKRSKSSEIEVK